MEQIESSSYLCQSLLAGNFVSGRDVQNAEAYRAKYGGSFRSILIRLGAISEENLLQFLVDFYGIQLIESDQVPTEITTFLDLINACDIDKEWWLDQEVLAWRSAEDTISYVAKDPLEAFVVEVLEKNFSGNNLTPFLIRSYDLEKALDLVSQFDADRNGRSDIDHLRELAEEAPVIEFVSNLLSQALDQRASDIHIEPSEHQMEVRFRIDGILYSRFVLPQGRFAAIASRVKLISGIDIAERRLPQDGRVSARISGVEVDLRVSTAPGVHGESIVLRLLPKEHQAYHLGDLGLQDDHYNLLLSLINEPNGIILVTGPTGSGKSTTLYAALEQINDRRRKIITVEDPVEFFLQGITQIQTHADIGYTFSRALRSIMRQDPDVVMIGEIRDKETAEIAIQASLTGHLVVSTLHTNNSISSFTRLIDMGIEPFLVATPVKAVMAQRLVRKICPCCSEPMAVMADMVNEVRSFMPAAMTGQEANWRKAVGCKECQGTGYKGRLGIYELVKVSAEIRNLILQHGSENDMWREARKQKMRTLREDGLLKAWQGLTTVEEVLRVASS